MFNNQKKAEMGVGTLIVFIAMLLVAAVAAGVLIQTASALQEKSLSTGQQARAQIATNARVIEVSASDGRDGNLSDFKQIIKLSPGSYPIKLDQIIFTFNTKDLTSTLKYKGKTGICQKNNTIGYNTWNEEDIRVDINSSINHFMLEEDYDDDGYDDYLFHNNTHFKVNLSSFTGIVFNVSMGCDGSVARASEAPANCSLVSTPFGNTTHVFGYIELDGQTQTNNTLIKNMTLKVTPYELGEGYFAAVYEQTGTNHVAGNLQRGDIIRLCYESPGEIVEDELVRLNFIPKIGTPTLNEFVTPDVISTQRVYLYP